MPIEVIRKKKIYFTDRYVIVEDVFRTIGSNKFPGGMKGSFVLVDTYTSKPRLLADNSDYPHEYHIHINLPQSKEPKVFLGTKDYLRAKSVFYKEVERIVNED